MYIKNKELLFALFKDLLPNNPIIVEAGAFNGNDTKRMATLWPEGHIHAFEPVPEIHALLEETTQNIANVTRHPIALSNFNGKQSFHISQHPKRPGKPFQAGSLLEPEKRLSWSPATYPTTCTVTTVTLDTWAEREGITALDLLWLDVQGYELPILKASPKILPHITLIFVEVNFIEAYKGCALYPEVKEWLESQGFEQIAYDFADQTSWFFGNALFAKKNEK
jgi:FkbM family methyltransferase